jgi:hypothetical protein
LIEKAFDKISLPDTKVTSSRDRLPVQRHMITWYMERGRIALASLLAREWFISKFMQSQRIEDLNDFDAREKARMDSLLTKKPNPTAKEAEKRWYRIWKELGLGNVRNEIAHAGQAHTEPKSAAEIKKKIETVIQGLDSLDPPRF